MNLYSIYTPSHKILFDNYFKPSLIEGEYELHCETRDQECSTGTYYESGWNQTTYRKVEYFSKIVEENIGNTFVFSDVDVQFFGKTKEILIEELDNFDIAAQDDTWNCLCSGFFICKSNERTINMFKSMKDNYHLYKEDQDALNKNRHLSKWKFLSRKFFTVGQLTNNVWNGENFTTPTDILMHHANWTISVENKIKLLEKVKNQIHRSKEYISSYKI
jgi:hypothetical protein